MKRDIKQTHRQTDTRTLRLLDQIGPVGRFDENRGEAKKVGGENIAVEKTGVEKAGVWSSQFELDKALAEDAGEEKVEAEKA